MRNHYNLLLIFLGFVWFLHPSTAHSYYFSSNDARSGGLGGCSAGFDRDITTGLTNPAALQGLRGKQIFAAHDTILMGTDLNLIEAAFPVKGSVFAAGIRTLRLQELEQRDKNGLLTGLFSEKYSSYRFSWAKKLIPALDLGVRISTFKRKLPEGFSTGYGYDIGCVFSYRPNLQLGLTFNNLGFKVKGNTLSRDYKIPKKIFYGFDYRCPRIPFEFLLELKKEDARQLTKHFGCEYTVVPALSLRFGYNDNHITYGAGLNLAGVRIDFAHNLSDIRYDTRISSLFRFNSIPLLDAINDRITRFLYPEPAAGKGIPTPEEQAAAILEEARKQLAEGNLTAGEKLVSQALKICSRPEIVRQARSVNLEIEKKRLELRLH